MSVCGAGASANEKSEAIGLVASNLLLTKQGKPVVPRCLYRHGGKVCE